MNIWQNQNAGAESAPADLDWITRLAAEALGAPLAMLFEQPVGPGQPRLLAVHGPSREAIRRLPATLPAWLSDPMEWIAGEVVEGPLRTGSYACVPIGKAGSGYRAVLCVADSAARPGGISGTERESLLLLAKLAFQQISSGRLTLDFNAMVSGDENSIIRRAAIERLRFALRDVAPAELCAA